MVKDFFGKIKENSLLTFLFFLLVSCCLWLLQVLNEDYETDIPFNVSIHNVPENLELVDGDNAEILVRVSDRGTVLSRYKLGKTLSLEVDFSDFKHNGGILSLPVSVLKMQMLNALEGSTSVIYFHEDTLFARVKQNRKLLPVALNGKVDAAEHFEITSVEISPADVMVSAMPDKLETMEFVETEYLVKRYLKGDKTFSVKVATDDYMNVEPAVVDVHISVSPLKVKKVRVPVVQVNFPRPSFAMWLPNEVELAFEVSEANYEMIGPGDFVVHLDYRDIVSARGGYAPLRLVSASPLVKNVVLKPARILVGGAL